MELGENSLQEKRSARHMLKLLDKHGILVVEDHMDVSLVKEINESRNLIEKSILWTDIKRHKDLLKKMSDVIDKILSALNQSRSDVNNGKIIGAGKKDLEDEVDVTNFIDLETRSLIGAFILHCADISNPGKKWENCERWAVLVMNEFFSQGDLQKKLGLKPSINCDRSMVSVPACQVGFGKYVIRDLYDLLSKILHDGGGYLIKHFNSNQEKWARIQAEIENTGVPYIMKFKPPSREGGWTGELRPNEK